MTAPCGRRAAIVLLLVAAPASAGAARGRLALSLQAGGGYSSDLFLGAGLGGDGFVEVTPAARLDLSLASRWKLAALADFSYGRFFSSDFTSLAETAAVESRWLGDPWELSLTIGGDHASYSFAAPLDPSLPGGPSVSSTLAARVSPLARLRLGGFEWRLGGVAGARTSTSPDGDIPERDLALVAGALRAITPGLSIALTYKLARTTSPRDEFRFTSHAGFCVVSWRVAPVDLQAQLQLQTAAIATGLSEQLGRLTLSAAYPITDALEAELVYALAASRSDDPSRPSATRHLVFAGLRWRALELTW